MPRIDNADELVAEIEDAKRELTRPAIDLWFQESTEWLTEAAERRAELGAASGNTTRADTGLYSIVQSARPPEWDERRGVWRFGFPHEGAVYQEFGARPHEIRAKKAEVLAFEWPDAPEEVKESFEETEGDLVFFESVEHPGLPAIGFVRYGREQARRFLAEQPGVSAKLPDMAEDDPAMGSGGSRGDSEGA